MLPIPHDQTRGRAEGERPFIGEILAVRLAHDDRTALGDRKRLTNRTDEIVAFRAATDAVFIAGGHPTPFGGPTPRDARRPAPRRMP